MNLIFVFCVLNSLLAVNARRILNIPDDDSFTSRNNDMKPITFPQRPGTSKRAQLDNTFNSITNEIKETRTCSITEHGTVWRDQCNDCQCYLGYSICTITRCFDEQSKTKPSISVISSSKNSEPSVDQLDSTKFEPSVDQLDSTISESSISDQTIPELNENFLCDDGARWYSRCNECSCRAAFPECTRRFCPSDFVQTQPDCFGNSRWFQASPECLWCVCVEEKHNCTKVDCPAFLGLDYDYDSVIETKAIVDPAVVQIQENVPTIDTVIPQDPSPSATPIQDLSNDEFCEPTNTHWYSGCKYCRCENSKVFCVAECNDGEKLIPPCLDGQEMDRDGQRFRCEEGKWV